MIFIEAIAVFLIWNKNYLKLNRLWLAPICIWTIWLKYSSSLYYRSTIVWRSDSDP